ncbi:MAG: HslU--HslV peptidase proteolytic subunit [Candidatus Hydrothermota bacterium]|nr:MAG: HslU--HslV peptidase proteolytic subunit [Candidatus Hydrothermae bacterium]
MHGTTIIGLIRDGKACIAGDGQVTLGNTVVKHTARKVRKLYKDTILAGFAGGVADALTLFEKMEEKLEEYSGNLRRAAVELAREWRSDKVLRRLEAILAVLDRKHAFIITGEGDIIEPEDKIVAIGSGGPYAYAAAKALLAHTNLDARTICEEAIKIAAQVCIYTNQKITILEL